MTAWDELIAKSTAPTGSDAWTHLISVGTGGGNTIVIIGDTDVIISEEEFAIELSEGVEEIVMEEIVKEIVVEEVEES